MGDNGMIRPYSCGPQAPLVLTWRHDETKSYRGETRRMCGAIRRETRVDFSWQSNQRAFWGSKESLHIQGAGGPAPTLCARLGSGRLIGMEGRTANVFEMSYLGILQMSERYKLHHRSTDRVPLKREPPPEFSESHPTPHTATTCYSTLKSDREATGWGSCGPHRVSTDDQDPALQTDLF